MIAISVSGAQISAVVQVQNADKAKSDLQDVGKSADNVSSGFGNMLKQGLANAAGFAIFNVGAKAVNFLGSQLSDTMAVAMQHQQVMAQTAQAIQSTGGAAGMSASAIDNLAMSLSKTTTFSDDTIQSGENLLLTFTGIGKDVFPATTKTMLDMAQAMHQGPTQAAMMLGKALNDPTTGLSALTRVGVTFSDQEKEQIKTMMAHNDVAGAQKVMLKELQTEFGGSAEAAGKTFGGQLEILKNRLTDVKQTIGGALLPVLGQMLGSVSGAVMPVLENFGNWFANDAIPAIQNFGSTVGRIFNSLPVQVFLSSVQALGTQLGNLFGTIGSVAQMIAGQFSGSFGGAGKQIKDLVSGALFTLDDILIQVGYKIRDFSQFLNQMDFGEKIDAVKQFGSTLANELGPPLKNIANLLKGELGKELNDLGKDAQQVGQWFMTSVVPAIKQALPGFENLGRTILTTVIPAAIQIRGVFVDVIQHAFEKFAPIIEKIVPPLIKFAGVLANDIANGLKFIMPYVLQAAKAIGDFASGLIDRVAPIVSNVFNGISAAVGYFMKGWMTAWPMISAVLKGVWDEMVGWIKIAWSIITGIINIGLDLISGNWGQMWTDIKNMFSGVWDGIKDILHGAWEMIVGVFTGIYDDLVGHSIIPDMINGIVSWFEQLPGRAMAFITNLVSSITTTLGGLGAKALTWAGDMISQFVSGILGGVGAVGDAVSKIAGKIASFIHFSKPDVGPLADVDNWMPDFGNLLAKGLNDQLGKVSGASLKLASTMSVNMNPTGGGFTRLPAGTSGIPASISQTSSNSTSSGQAIHIHNYIDGKEMTDSVGPRIIKNARTSGPIRSSLS